MHHFRGRLLDGDQALLDPANVYIQFHHSEATGSVPGWHGYLLIEPGPSDLEPGGPYTLTLTDGEPADRLVDCG